MEIVKNNEQEYGHNKETRRSGFEASVSMETKRVNQAMSACFKPKKQALGSHRILQNGNRLSSYHNNSRTRATRRVLSLLRLVVVVTVLWFVTGSIPVVLVVALIVNTDDSPRRTTSTCQPTTTAGLSYRRPPLWNCVQRRQRPKRTTRLPWELSRSQSPLNGLPNEHTEGDGHDDDPVLRLWDSLDDVASFSSSTATQASLDRDVFNDKDDDEWLWSTTPWEHLDETTHEVNWFSNDNYPHEKNNHHDTDTSTSLSLTQVLDDLQKARVSFSPTASRSELIHLWQQQQQQQNQTTVSSTLEPDRAPLTTEPPKQPKQPEQDVEAQELLPEQQQQPQSQQFQPQTQPQQQEAQQEEERRWRREQRRHHNNNKKSTVSNAAASLASSFVGSSQFSRRDRPRSQSQPMGSMSKSNARRSSCRESNHRDRTTTFRTTTTPARPSTRAAPRTTGHQAAPMSTDTASSSLPSPSVSWRTVAATPSSSPTKTTTNKRVSDRVVDTTIETPLHPSDTGHWSPSSSSLPGGHRRRRSSPPSFTDAIVVPASIVTDTDHKDKDDDNKDDRPVEDGDADDERNQRTMPFTARATPMQKESFVHKSREMASAPHHDSVFTKQDTMPLQSEPTATDTKRSSSLSDKPIYSPYATTSSPLKSSVRDSSVTSSSKLPSFFYFFKSKPRRQQGHENIKSHNRDQTKNGTSSSVPASDHQRPDRFQTNNDQDNDHESWNVVELVDSVDPVVHMFTQAADYVLFGAFERQQQQLQQQQKQKRPTKVVVEHDPDQQWSQAYRTSDSNDKNDSQRNPAMNQPKSRTEDDKDTDPRLHVGDRNKSSRSSAPSDRMQSPTSPKQRLRRRQWEERLDKLMGIHEDGSFYNSWISDEPDGESNRNDQSDRKSRDGRRKQRRGSELSPDNLDPTRSRTTRPNYSDSDSTPPRRRRRRTRDEQHYSSHSNVDQPLWMRSLNLPLDYYNNNKNDQDRNQGFFLTSLLFGGQQQRRHYPGGLFPSEQEERLSDRHDSNGYSQPVDRSPLSWLDRSFLSASSSKSNNQYYSPRSGSSNSLQLLNALGVVGRLGSNLVRWASVRGTLPPQLVWVTTGMAALMGPKHPIRSMVLSLLLMRVMGEWLVVTTNMDPVEHKDDAAYYQFSSDHGNPSVPGENHHDRDGTFQSRHSSQIHQQHYDDEVKNE